MQQAPPGFLIINQMSPQLIASYGSLSYTELNLRPSSCPTRPHMTALGTLTLLVPSPRYSRDLLLGLTLGFLLPEMLALSSSFSGRHFIQGVMPTLPLTPHQSPLPHPASFSSGTSHHPKWFCLFGLGICLSRASRSGR